MRFRHYLDQSPHLVVFSATVMLAAVFFGTLLFFTGFFAGFIMIWAIPLLALCWIGIFLFHLFKGNRRPDQRVAAIVLCSAPFIFFALGWATLEVWEWGTFAVRYNGYRHVVALAEQNRLPPPAQDSWQIADNGTTFEAERTGLKRIAFPLPGGFLSEWTGILYDPQGVGQHPPQRQKDGKIEDRLNGGDTIETCSHLIGRFYRCSFS